MTLYTLSGIARKLGLSAAAIHNNKKKHGFPKHSYTTDTGVKLWAEDQIGTIEAIVTKKHGEMYSVAQLAKVLGVDTNTAHAWKLKGYIPAPTHKRGLRYYYTAQEFEKIQKTFKRTAPRYRSLSLEAELHGYFTKKRAAVWLDVPFVTLASWLDKGKLPQPTHTVNGYQCYTAPELDHFKRHQLADYFAKRKCSHPRGRT